jgi:hypothetical protein
MDNLPTWHALSSVDPKRFHDEDVMIWVNGKTVDEAGAEFRLQRAKTGQTQFASVAVFELAP